MTTLLQTNLEIKARCADLDAARERTRVLATRSLGIDRQTDTYFATERGRLVCPRTVSQWSSSFVLVLVLDQAVSMRRTSRGPSRS